MPTSEPMTTGEIARALVAVNSKLDGISVELRDKPGKDQFQDYRDDQNRKHDEQDKNISRIEARTDKLLFAVIGTALAAATNLITNIAGG